MQAGFGKGHVDGRLGSRGEKQRRLRAPLGASDSASPCWWLDGRFFSLGDFLWNYRQNSFQAGWLAGPAPAPATPVPPRPSDILLNPNPTSWQSQKSKCRPTEMCVAHSFKNSGIVCVCHTKSCMCAGTQETCLPFPSINTGLLEAVLPQQSTS